MFMSVRVCLCLPPCKCVCVCGVNVCKCVCPHHTRVSHAHTHLITQVGPDEHVICALSGGVDSTVAATLVHKALGDRLHCVFVDNGLLRYKVRSLVCVCLCVCDLFLEHIRFERLMQGPLALNSCVCLQLQLQHRKLNA